MAYCPNCGVELAPDALACPLCLAPLGPDAPRRHAPEHIIDPEDREKLTDAERRTIVWEIISVSTGIAAIVVCAVNLIESQALTWGLYPLASLCFFWVLLTAPLRLGSRPVLAILLAALSLPAFLVALDLVDGRLGWSLSVALPIALDAEISAALAVLASARSKRKGANLIGFGLLAATALCVGIEATLDRFQSGRLDLTWSAIVAVALVPVAGFLFYLHHRVTKKANLRRLFRL
jgi:hypothetical protein